VLYRGRAPALGARDSLPTRDAPLKHTRPPSPLLVRLRVLHKATISKVQCHVFQTVCSVLKPNTLSVIRDCFGPKRSCNNVKPKGPRNDES